MSEEQPEDTTERWDKVGQMDQPCPQCPFSRATDKEYLDTRGDNGPRFAAQANMAAVLPCHMECGDGLAKPGRNSHCAGAAKFRANIGVAHKLPPGVGKVVPPDHGSVFSDEVELLAHHMGVTEVEAEKYLRDLGIEYLVMREMMEAERKGLLKPL